MKRKRFVILNISILLTFLILYVIYANKGSGELEFNLSKNGIVPDAATAIKVAETIGLPIFGKNLKEYKPFQARLENDSIWHIYGLPKKTWFYVQLGGCPVWEIKKKDGKILRVYLSK